MPPCGDEQCYARDWLREAPKLRSNAVARTGRLPIYLLHTTQDAILLVVTWLFLAGFGPALRSTAGLLRVDQFISVSVRLAESPTGSGPGFPSVPDTRLN